VLSDIEISQKWRVDLLAHATNAQWAHDLGEYASVGLTESRFRHCGAIPNQHEPMHSVVI